MHLTSTSDIIRLVTASAVTIDVQASWDDYTTTTLTPGRTNTAITTATTTTIVASPAASTQRRCNKLVIHNKHASSSNLVTVEHYDGTTAVQVARYTLLAGEQLEYGNGHWATFDANGRLKIGGGAGGGDALISDPLSQFAATSSAQLAGVISDETGSGALVFATSPTVTTPTISGAIVFPDNVTQTFNPGADNAGINVGAMAGDPATPDNGDIWYDSTANELTARVNGANVNVVAGGGASTALSNLAAVAINASLISDTDITDDLGVQGIRWRDIYSATLRTGSAINDTLKLEAKDVDGASWTTFITFTANNTPTCVIQNTRINTRVQAVTDAATITPNADADDLVDITAIAQAFTLANPSGTPTNGQKLIVRIKDNGTGRAITFGANYAAGGITLPTTTVASKILRLAFMYNTANALNKWELLAKNEDA